MISRLLVLVICAIQACPRESQAAGRHDNETVVIMHGILNRPFVMKKIERACRNAGYATANRYYPTTRLTVEEHAAELDSFIKTLPSDHTIHFVGFSLGSLVIRYYLSHYQPKNIGRFVMIAPPNHGSEMVDILYPYAWFRWIYGTKSIQQLKSTNQIFFKKCGVPPCEFGIIAGGRGNDIGRSRAIPGDDDGSISLTSARMEGSKDFLVLNHRHTLLLFCKETCENVVSFLESGKFLGTKKHVKR